MTAWLAAAIVIALLTATQIVVHLREYGLLIWPQHRSARHQGRPRLPLIGRWEATYYSVASIWVVWSWLAFETPPSIWLMVAILFFAASHILGFWSIHNEREVLAAATDAVKRDSSISELAAMMARQYKSYRPMLALVAVHDAIELLVFAWISAYLISTISSLIGAR